MSEAKLLTAAMDNVIASRLGEAARESLREGVGDSIDAGLRLRRLLEEAGFGIVRLEQEGTEGTEAKRIAASVESWRWP